MIVASPNTVNIQPQTVAFATGSFSEEEIYSIRDALEADYACSPSRNFLEFGAQEANQQDYYGEPSLRPEYTFDLCNIDDVDRLAHELVDRNEIYLSAKAFSLSANLLRATEGFGRGYGVNVRSAAVQYGLCGDPEAAVEHYRLLLENQSEIGATPEVSVKDMTYCALGLLYLGLPAEARSLTKRALDVHSSIPLPGNLLTNAHFIRGLSLDHLGQLDEAGDAFQEAYYYAQTSTAATKLSQYISGVSRMHARKGDHLEAMKILREHALEMKDDRLQATSLLIQGAFYAYEIGSPADMSYFCSQAEELAIPPKSEPRDTDSIMLDYIRELYVQKFRPSARVKSKMKYRQVSPEEHEKTAQELMVSSKHYGLDNARLRNTLEHFRAGKAFFAEHRETGDSKALQKANDHLELGVLEALDLVRQFGRFCSRQLHEAITTHSNDEQLAQAAYGRALHASFCHAQIPTPFLLEQGANDLVAVREAMESQGDVGPEHKYVKTRARAFAAAAKALTDRRYRAA